MIGKYAIPFLVLPYEKAIRCCFIKDYSEKKIKIAHIIIEGNLKKSLTDSNFGYIISKK